MSNDSLQHRLAERVKELTALHRTARLLQGSELGVPDLLARITDFLPAAWQYPEIAGARVSLLGHCAATANFRETPWLQRADFSARAPDPAAPQGGSIEVCYLESRPLADEGPFLIEERHLIDSLADMLRSYLQHHLADAALRAAHDRLEFEVRERTAELQAANRDLEAEIAEHRRARREIERYQRQLRRLASELSLAEERERRAIATDLHDHLGQALAFLRLRLAAFAGNAVFCGFEGSIQELLVLVEQAIRYTRTLTGELSPPVLYELGLGPALEWLGEQAAAKHGWRVTVDVSGLTDPLPQETRVMLFKSAHELLANAAKHAQAASVRIELRRDADACRLEVTDDGIGFAPERVAAAERAEEAGGFGLFSIRERLRGLDGTMEVRSTPGAGARIVLRVPLAPGGEEAP